ncbi:MAG: cupredoxin domain-containing protein [bacterium]|nr:cupredoxin domain-containing protein [bacterium]
MNKYLILIGVGVLIIGGGIIYRVFFLSEASKPVVTGKVREITIIARKDRWIFVPEIIEVTRGDKIVATIINEDAYDHGIAIDAFGISQRMPANSTIKVEFVVTQEGDFPFYCSVPCGEGIVDGVKRTHFDMIGKLHVRSIMSSTQ